MVYDITDPASFEHLANWKSHFLSRSQPDNPSQLPFLVLGNKLDLIEEDSITSKRRV
jgi:GTPase SAR1 family protein